MSILTLNISYDFQQNLINQVKRREPFRFEPDPPNEW